MMPEIAPARFRNICRGAVFIGVNLLALLTIYAVAISPIVTVFADQADRIAQAREALSRYRAVAAEEASVRAAADLAGGQVASGVFLQGASEGALSAELQAHLKSVADHAGARVQSVRSLEPISEGELHYRRAHIELSGPTRSIYATIRAIEGGEPRLFITTAALRMPAGAVGLTPSQEPSIEASLDIFGLAGHDAAAP
jgi:hypothetical protein